MTKPHDSREAEDPSAGLGARRAAILEAVVAEYIGTAIPVGSSHVANAPGVHVSSATVRSDMAALEQEGYLVQPHTSAGRIPTDKGYRFFVDHLAEPGVLGTAQRLKVRRFFDQVHGEMEELLEHASGLLSELTSCAAVVMGPSHESAWFRSVQLVGLSPRLALLVVVLSDGAVEKRSIELAEDLSDELLAEVTTELARRLSGRPLSEVDQLIAPPAAKSPTFGVVFDAAARALGEIVRPGEVDQVFVGGPSRLADAFDAMETVRSVLSILEQQLVVVTLLRDVLDSGLSVAIGAEHGYQPLASCAVVVAPVVIDGRDGGAVGLLGPTRMNYPQALAAAHVVGEGLSERLRDPVGGRSR
ncbi:MAG TPA: heat-inducible transcriptional repressor HrcA [Acidimicrobiales bacterium]|nr:heat-inducible transcriptional repressor HrcA [Acidimicrobiales bacterium]